MHPLCLIRHHDWLAKAVDDEPYEVCSRCWRRRNNTSWVQLVQGLDGPPAGEGRPPSSDPPRHS